MSRSDTYYGFNTEIVNKKFNGGLTYCNTFCTGYDRPAAVYKVANPDRSKGHKDYMLLWNDEYCMGWVSGMNADRMEQWRYQKGLKCNKCGDVMYSIDRHDFRHCKCGACAVDGGRDYLKISGEANSYEIIVFDLLENCVASESETCP